MGNIVNFVVIAKSVFFEDLFFFVLFVSATRHCLKKILFSESVIGNRHVFHPLSNLLRRFVGFGHFGLELWPRVPPPLRLKMDDRQTDGRTQTKVPPLQPITEMPRFNQPRNGRHALRVNAVGRNGIA